jgi:chitinase
LNQPAKWDRVLSHFQIQELRKDPSYLDYWDEISQNSFLFSPSKREWITYESPSSIKKKIEYMNQKDLAGVMFWELSEDPSLELLDAIDQHINKSN